VTSYKDYPGIEGGGPIGFVSRLEHRMLERKVSYHASVLEIGGGEGGHARFLKDGFESYTVIDLFVPQKLNPAKNVKFILGSAENLPFAAETFDRVLVTCVLAHLKDPIQAINEALRVLKPGGTLSILISNDPGALYTVMWNLFGRRARTNWANEDPVLGHALEHLISGKSLKKVINSLASNYEVKTIGFPFVLKSYNFNISTIFQIKASPLSP